MVCCSLRGGVRNVAKLGLGAEQSARQQGLHVAASIGDQDDDNLLPDYPVNQSIRLEKDLTVFAYAKRQEFAGAAAALGEGGESFCGFQQLIQHMVCAGFRVERCDVVVEGFEILLGTGGQVDSMRHLLGAQTLHDVREGAGVASLDVLVAECEELQ